MKLKAKDKMGQALVALAKMMTLENGRTVHFAVCAFVTDKDHKMEHAEGFTTFGGNPIGLMQCGKTLFDMGKETATQEQLDSVFTPQERGEEPHAPTVN